MRNTANLGDRRGESDDALASAAAPPAAAPTDGSDDQASNSGAFVIHKVGKKGV